MDDVGSFHIESVAKKKRLLRKIIFSHFNPSIPNVLWRNKYVTEKLKFELPIKITYLRFSPKDIFGHM